jgi:hypothetical protein
MYKPQGWLKVGLSALWPYFWTGRSQSGIDQDYSKMTPSCLSSIPIPSDGPASGPDVAARRRRERNLHGEYLQCAVRFFAGILDSV